MSQLFVTNAYKFDPTRTTLLRRQYEAEMRRRFRQLKKDIEKFLIDDDKLSLAVNYDYRKDPNKIGAFMRWLNQQTQNTVFRGTPVGTTQRSWQDVYIQSAYQKGLATGAGRMRKQGATVRDEYISSAFFQPIHADSVGLLYTRAYTDLAGVTQAMGTRMGRELASSMIDGLGMKDTAKRLLDVVDIGITRARTIARSEIIAAHAEATLNLYEQADAEGVEIESEFSTSRDNAVCEECSALEGKVFSLDEARGLIPVHPNCRCAWVPRLRDARKVSL